MLLLGGTPDASAEVIVPGLASSELDSELKGLVLIEELNCVACHESEGAVRGSIKEGAPTLRSRLPG